MFDETFEMAGRCAEAFRNGVNDAFGSSVIADVLDPICNEIGSLRSFNEDFQRQSLNIDQVLKDARSCHLIEGSDR